MTKFTLHTTDLLGALNDVTLAVPVRSTLAYLEYVQFVVTPKQVTLRATDLNIFISRTLETDAKSDGIFLLNAKMLARLVAGFSADEVTFDVANGKAVITCGNNTTKLPYLTDNLPSAESIKPLHTVTLLGSVLSESIKLASVSALPSTTGIVLETVLFSFTDKALQVVGTSGKTLSTVKNDIKSSFNFATILARKEATLISKLFTDGDVKLGLSENVTTVSSEGIEFSCRNFDGNYPNLQGVIPKEGLECEFHIFRKELIGALTRVTAFSTDNDTALVKLTVSKDTLNVSSENTEIGSHSEESIPITYDGTVMEMYYNAKQLLPILNSVADETIGVEMYGKKATKLIPNDNTLLLAMPYTYKK